MLKALRLLKPTASNLRASKISLYSTCLSRITELKSEKDIEDVIRKRNREKIDKRAANKRIAEVLYFPDQTEKLVEQFIKEKEKKQRALGIEGDNSEKIKLTYEDLKQIEAIYSDGRNEHALKGSIYNPQTQEEMDQLIEVTDINHTMLINYMKFHRLCKKPQIVTIIKKLQKNLDNQEVVKMRELEKHKRRVEQLMKHNPKVDLEMKAMFLTKEEILNHNGFKFLVESINFKANKKVYEPYTTLDLYHFLMRFDSRSVKLFDKKYILDLFEELGNQKIYTLGKMLNFLQYYKDLELTEMEREALFTKIMEELERKEFKDIQTQEILSIMLPIKKNGLVPSAQVMFRLEPYIVKYLKSWDAVELSEIYLTYLTYGAGTQQFMEFLLNGLAIKVDSIPLRYMKTIFSLSNPLFSRRADIEFSLLNNILTKKMISNIRAWNFTPKELIEIIKSLLYNRTSDENFYEMLSVELLKKTSTITETDFLEAYYLLATAGINSEALAFSILPKLRSSLDDYFNDFHKSKIAGLLENSSPKLPTDETLRESSVPNRVEREYMQAFRNAARALWAYSYFIIRTNGFKKVDLDLWTKTVFELNKMIRKINTFMGLTKLMRRDHELLYQINSFASLYGKNALELEINTLENSKVYFMKPRYPAKQSLSMLIFSLEKKYFLQKYGQFLQQWKSQDQYIFDAILTNPTDKSQTRVFINDFNNYLGIEESKPRSNGHLLSRQHILNDKKLPYVDVSYEKFCSDLQSSGPKEKLFFEEFLSRYFTLPEVEENLSEVERSSLEELKKKIYSLRREIPETSLEIISKKGKDKEEDLIAAFKDKKVHSHEEMAEMDDDKYPASDDEEYDKKK